MSKPIITKIYFENIHKDILKKILNYISCFDLYQLVRVSHHFQQTIPLLIKHILQYQLINIFHTRKDITDYTEPQLLLLCRREEYNPLIRSDIVVKDKCFTLYSNGNLMVNDITILKNIISYKYYGLGGFYVFLSKNGKLYIWEGLSNPIIKLKEMENIINICYSGFCLDKYGLTYQFCDNQDIRRCCPKLVNLDYKIILIDNFHGNRDFYLSNEGQVYYSGIIISDLINIIDFDILCKGYYYSLICLNWRGDVYQVILDVNNTLNSRIQIRKIILLKSKIKTIACGNNELYLLDTTNRIFSMGGVDGPIDFSKANNNFNKPIKIIEANNDINMLFTNRGLSW